MVTYMVKKTSLLLIAYLGALGCSPSSQKIVVSGYSLQPEEFINFGAKDLWSEVWAPIALDENLVVKIQPSSWYSVNLEKKQCGNLGNDFYFYIWSKDKAYLSIEKSFFLSSSFKRKFFEVRVKSGLEWKSHTSSELFELMESDNELQDIESWLTNERYTRFNNSYGANVFKVVSKGKVGCSTEKYKLHLSFEYPGDVVKNYLIYFFPVQYTGVSR